MLINILGGEAAMTAMTGTASGLEGVVVADTTLSEVDGERGRLVIRGFDVEALARAARFEDAALLLLSGALPREPERGTLRERRFAPSDGCLSRGDPQRGAFAAALGAARVRAFGEVARLGDALERPDGMDALRA